MRKSSFSKYRNKLSSNSNKVLNILKINEAPPLIPIHLLVSCICPLLVDIVCGTQMKNNRRTQCSRLFHRLTLFLHELHQKRNRVDDKDVNIDEIVQEQQNLVMQHSENMTQPLRL